MFCIVVSISQHGYARLDLVHIEVYALSSKVWFQYNIVRLRSDVSVILYLKQGPESTKLRLSGYCTFLNSLSGSDGMP